MGGKRALLKLSYKLLKDNIKSFKEDPLDSIWICPDTIQESVEDHITTEQDLQNLYANPNFRLIRVTKDQDPNVPPRMQLVRPSMDDAARQDLLSNDKRYYCISHCWGPEEERITWEDSNIVDVDGNQLPVEIRRNKCDRLLDLLKTHGGYWWIDIFCAHENYGNPPLEFMDDIYRHCKRCFALLDCPKGAIDTVASHILGSWSHFDNIPFRTKSEALVEKYVEYVSKNANNDEATNKDMLIKIMVETVYPEVDVGFARAISGIIQCPWYSRVWTLQEAMLPCHTVLMGEDMTLTSSEVDYQFISTIIHHVTQAAAVAEKRIAANRATRDIPSQRPQRSLRSSTKTFLYSHFSPATMERAHELLEYIKLLKVSVGDAYYPLLLHTLSMTKRQCQYERDYIFGVLGILGIRLSFTEDLKVLWKDFLTELEPLLPKDSDLPWHYDLAKASGLDDVFESFNPKQLLDKTASGKYLSSFFVFHLQ